MNTTIKLPKKASDSEDKQQGRKSPKKVFKKKRRKEPHIDLPEAPPRMDMSSEYLYKVTLHGKCLDITSSRKEADRQVAELVKRHHYTAVALVTIRNTQKV